MGTYLLILSLFLPCVFSSSEDFSPSSENVSDSVLYQYEVLKTNAHFYRKIFSILCISPILALEFVVFLFYAAASSKSDSLSTIFLIALTCSFDYLLYSFLYYCLSFIFSDPTSPYRP